MASDAAIPTQFVGPDSTFCAVLQEVSRSLGTQVSLAGRCLALHPQPPPGFDSSALRAVTKLRAAVDEFWLDVVRASDSGEVSQTLGSDPGQEEQPCGVSLARPGSKHSVIYSSEHSKELQEGPGGVSLARPVAKLSVIYSSETSQEPWGPMTQEESDPAPSGVSLARPGAKCKPIYESDALEACVLVNEPVPTERTVHDEPGALGQPDACTDVTLPEEPPHKQRNSWLIESAENSMELPLVAARACPTRQSFQEDPDVAGMPLARQTSQEWPALTDTFLAPNKDTVTESMAKEAVEESPGEPFLVKGAFNPNWIGRLVWDVGIIFLVLVDAVVLPYQMAYNHGSDPDLFDHTWLWLTTTFFALDMVLSFFTAYVATAKDKSHTEPGKLVTKRHRITRHYLRGWFGIDFVSTIPWSTFADFLTSSEEGNNSTQVAKLTKVVKFVRFLRLMRMLRLAKLGVIWERIEAKMGSLILLQIMALCRVFFLVVGICHWNACIWWMVGQPESLITELMSTEAQAAWKAKPHWTVIRRAHDPNSEDWSWIEKGKAEAYVFCFYWTLGVMRTMPSEVTPVNLAERLYVMLFMLFAVSAFAISVTLITQAFLKIGERRRIFNEDMAFARMHLRNIQASESLQGKVKSFLTHLYNRRRIQAKEANLFSQLPPTLTKLMKYSTIMVHLKKVGLLSTFDKRAMFAISELVDVRDLVPGERLSTRNAVARGAWILVIGTLRTVLESRATARRNSDAYALDVKTVQVVDEETLGTRKPYHSARTIVAGTCCEVIYICKRRFLKVVKAERLPADDVSEEGLVQEDASRVMERQSSPEDDGSEEAEGNAQPTALKNSAHTAAIISA